MTDSWILAFIKTIAQFYHWNWGSHDERSCHPEKPMQGQRAKKPRVGLWHQNIFQAWKLHPLERNLNKKWITSFMRNIMMVYSIQSLKKIGCDSEYSDLMSYHVLTMRKIIFPKSKRNKSSIACYVIIQRPVGTPRHLFSIFMGKDLRLLQGSNITKIKPR